jgi:hypothetical protein
MNAMSRVRFLGAATVGLSALVALGAAAPGAASVVAGPPAICFPVQCDDSGIPLDDSKGATNNRYKAEEAIAKAIGVLDTSTDPLVHMETIRRVTICLGDNAARTNELLARLLARAADAEAVDAGAPKRELAWLDAGFYVGAASQIGATFNWKPGEKDGVLGLAWLDRAIEAGEGDPAVHFAAALVGHPATNKSKASEYQSHLRAAIAGAPQGSMLRKNLDAHVDAWGDLTGLQ